MKQQVLLWMATVVTQALWKAVMGSSSEQSEINSVKLGVVRVRRLIPKAADEHGTMMG